MIDRIRQLLKLLNALSRILPVVLDVLVDLSDDGKRNNSNTSKASVPPGAKKS